MRVSAALRVGDEISTAPEKLSTINLSVEPSLILNRLVPKVLAPEMTTSPVPSVLIVRSPFAFVVEIVLPSSVILSTFHS